MQTLLVTILVNVTMDIYWFLTNVKKILNVQLETNVMLLLMVVGWIKAFKCAIAMFVRFKGDHFVLLLMSIVFQFYILGGFYTRAKWKTM